jgi:Complex I intermediate-associated protein 30 (CIA30)
MCGISQGRHIFSSTLTKSTVSPPQKDPFIHPPAYIDVGKRYTITLSNEIAEKRPDGQDASSVLYEYSFHCLGDSELRKVEWNEFEAQYRGKPKDDAPPVDVGRIRRWNIMIRSFFDAQHGEFAMGIRSISAYSEKEKGDEV